MTHEGTRLDPRSFFGAVLLGLVLLGLAAQALSLYRVVRPAEPLEPWEAAFTHEAWRVAHGVDAYRPVQPGLATHMYGPLMQELVGPLLRLTGPDNRVGRLVNLAASLAGIAFLVVLACPRRDPWARLVYFALLLSAHNFALAYFAVHKPDAIGIFLALAGLALHARAMLGLAARPLLAHLAAIALLVASFFLKQNIAGLALAAPLGYVLACVLKLERPTLRRLALACAPPLAVFATIVVLRLGFEVPYLYLLRLPAAYPISPRGFVDWTIHALQAYPVLALVLGLALAQREHLAPRRSDPYVVAALAAAWLISTAAAAKQGGNANSMLAFLVVLAGAGAHLMERVDALGVLQRAAAGPALPARAAGLVVAGLVAISLLPLDPPKAWGAHTPARSRDFHAAVAQVRALEGSVLSPEDPTILLQAGKAPGLNLYLEFNLTEVTGRPGGRWPTAELEALIVEADHVVEVKFLFLGYFDLFDASGILPRHGFVRSWQNESYALWRKVRS